MAPEPALTVAYLNWATLMQYPVIACEVLVFFEALRVLPGEFRMLLRIYKRGKPNVAEILFFLTKYMAVFAFISDALTELTSYWLNPTGCLAFSWIYQLCLYSCTTTISATLAWRCYVIFQRRYRVGAYLLAGLALQFALAMATCQAQLRFKEVEDGYCKIPDADIEAVADKPVWKKFGPWFLFFMVIFDGTLVISTSWRLIRCVRGPSGLQRIGKLLFVNNLHYLAIVCGLNATEAILYIWFASILPNLLPLTIVIEIMIGLQLLISEQDAAHGYGKSHVQMGAHSNAPSSFTRPSTTNTAASQSQWTDSKRRLNTSNSTQQLNSMTSTAGGIDGIRYDCTEEVLIDYDMTLTRLAPNDTDVEPWGDGHPLGSAAEFSSSTAVGSGSSPKYHANAPGAEHSPSSADAEPNASNGFSIRAIRANMNNRSPPGSSSGAAQRAPTLGSNNPYAHAHECSPASQTHSSEQSPFAEVSGNYETKVNQGNNHAQGASPRGPVKRSESLASFGSAATGFSGHGAAAPSYGAALSRAASNAGSRSAHQQPSHGHGHILAHPGDESLLDDTSFEAMLPRNHDAPFTGYGHVSPAPPQQQPPALIRRDTGRSSLLGGGSAY